MKAQEDEAGGRILPGDNTGGGAVMPRSIKLHCVGVQISTGLLCIHIHNKLHEYTIPTWANFDWRWALKNVSTAHVEFTGDTARTNLLFVPH